MRKNQQRQLLELTKSLFEANAELERLLARDELDAVMQLLCDCQSIAILMGELIESFEGEGTQTVSSLEEYHEDLYSVSCAVGEKTSKLNDTKNLRKKIIAVETNIKTELKPNKIEVVFFPYKASMWDSFESVWFAAKDDPQCDVYVIPIPYYDKQTSGNQGEMHYEGDLFPAYVPVIDWREYNIEEQCPDVAFVHNPYDGNGFVTTVHPNYYSFELKRYTDFLVYIDYGLPIWLFKTPKKGILLKSFSVYDLIITYSKEYAESIRCSQKPIIKQKNSARSENNAIALGSPKFDAIFNTNRDNYSLPRDWLEKINEKKVLLFSTSVSAMLDGNEQFFVRQQELFSTLRERDDIVLWWRPHPLSETTYSVMRPQLLEEYKRIVKQYCEEGWGIYDDTPDLHRAIAWSDACYSDESSLLLLYLATGKPFSTRTFLYKPEKSTSDSSSDFTPILKQRIKNMRAAKGANVFDINCTIWWHNFVDADFVNSIQYSNFIDRFIHFILNEPSYPDAEAYRQLKKQMFHEFVENADGTAGQKIYEFTKKKYWGASDI